MIILGIDPGLANTGWGIINYQLPITNYQLIGCGVVETKIESGNAERLGEIYKQIEKIIKKYRVDEVAIEGLFFAKNAKSAIKVAEAIGVIKVCAFNNGVKVFEYTPLRIKMSLTGYGRAEKGQVELMVRNLLKLEDLIKPAHASDAVAVALAHSFVRGG